MEAILKGYKVAKMEFFNGLNSEGSVPLETNVQYRVQYNNKTETCVADCTVTVRSKDDPDKLHILVQMLGMFQCKGGWVEQRELQQPTFRELFPYLRMTVTNLSTMAGMSPVIIPPVRFQDNNDLHINA